MIISTIVTKKHICSYSIVQLFWFSTKLQHTFNLRLYVPLDDSYISGRQSMLKYIYRALYSLLSLANYFRNDYYLVGLDHSYYSCLSCLFSVTLDSPLTTVQHKATPLQLGRTTLFIIPLHIIIF